MTILPFLFLDGIASTQQKQPSATHYELNEHSLVALDAQSLSLVSHWNRAWEQIDAQFSTATARGSTKMRITTTSARNLSAQSLIMVDVRTVLTVSIVSMASASSAPTLLGPQSLSSW